MLNMIHQKIDRTMWQELSISLLERKVNYLRENFIYGQMAAVPRLFLASTHNLSDSECMIKTRWTGIDREI
jgi:hypothetical protein